MALTRHTEALLDGCLPQRRQERAPQQPAEDTHWQEKARGTGDPRRAIQRQATCGDQAMDRGMMVQRLPPGRQDPEKADLGASVLGITGNRRERLGRGLKQQAVDHARMLQGEGTELSRKGKNHMTVGHLQQLAFAGCEPGSLGTPLALGAVPIAVGVITDRLVAPVITLSFVAPEDRRAARRDGLEHPVLCRRGHGAIAGEVGVPRVPDDVGHFQERAAHSWGAEGAGGGHSSRGLGMTASA